MFKFLKKCILDINEMQKSYNEIGLFTIHTIHGSFIHYINNEKTTHINTDDDKQRTIQTDNSDS